MKLKQLVAFTALIGLPLFASAQKEDNLVDNGGFESSTGKPKKIGQIDLATGWISPTGSRADYFMSDSKLPDVGVPENAFGKEQAKEGENYAGIVAFSYGNKMPRSYIMAKLKTPLKKDVTYCISFYVSMSEASKYACNQIGANISKKAFGTDQKVHLIDQTQIQHPDNKVFNATYNWEKVCGSYKAEGGEKFLTIGNFTSDQDTKYETNKKPKDSKITQIVAAYYYIDEVVVTMLDKDGECKCYTDDKDKNEQSTTVYMKQVADNDKMSTKDRIEKQEVYFGFGKTFLTPQAKAALDIVAKVMTENPTMSITVIGSNNEEEDKLAEKKDFYADMDTKRNQAVKEYLLSKGISATRLKSESKGNEEPSPEIKESDDEDLKLAKNRRVIFKVN
ncbi:OmpA family protein [Fluviicola taffensis]|nr:OmpA family protein [Fluviicola taffensis]